MKLLHAIGSMVCVLLFQHHRAMAADDTWVLGKSPHFVVAAESSVTNRGEIAHCLEGTHDLLMHLIPSGCSFDSRVTSVYLFETPESYAMWTGSSLDEQLDQIGMTSMGPSGIVIAMGPPGEFDSCQIVARLFIRGVIGTSLGSFPLWFQTGLKEYISSIAVGKDACYIGRLIPEFDNKLAANDQMALGVLLETTNDSAAYRKGERETVFTAQSWALVHYLFEEDPGLRVVREVCRSLEEGEESRRVLEGILEMDLETIETKLNGKIRKARYEEITWPFRSGKAHGIVSSVSLSRVETALKGAELLACVSPHRAGEVHSLLGFVRKNGADETAVRRIEGILAETVGDTQGARVSYSAVLDQAPGNDEATLGLARVHLRSTGGDSTSVALFDHLTSANPDDPDLWFELARASYRSDARMAAEAYLTGLTLCPTSGSTWKELGGLLDDRGEEVRDVLSSWPEAPDSLFNARISHLLK